MCSSVLHMGRCIVMGRPEKGQICTLLLVALMSLISALLCYLVGSGTLCKQTARLQEHQELHFHLSTNLVLDKHQKRKSERNRLSLFLRLPHKNCLFPSLCCPFFLTNQWQAPFECSANDIEISEVGFVPWL